MSIALEALEPPNPSSQQSRDTLHVPSHVATATRLRSFCKFAAQMARGNERDEARKKAEKKAGGVVSYPQLHVSPDDTVAQNVLVHAN
jgi:hypothetical protein